MPRPDRMSRAQRFLGGKGQRFTDILVLRLSAKRAHADLSEILRRTPPADKLAGGSVRAIESAKGSL